MSVFRNKRAEASSKASNASEGLSAEVDLRKLRRVDLLELLYDQIRENEQNAKQIEELSELSERLKAKLDDKDAQIDRLKQRLNSKDEKIAALESHLDIAPGSFVVFGSDRETVKAEVDSSASTWPSSDYSADASSHASTSQQVAETIKDEAHVNGVENNKSSISDILDV